MKISIIVPVLNEEEVIFKFYKRLKLSLKKDFKTAKHEIIFINDGSFDNTQKFINEIRRKDKNVHFIEFTKNFGQHSAIFAGLKKSTGNFIVVTDADLQDRPEEIINLYKKLSKGFNIIYSIRKTNNYPFFKKTTSLIFWKILKISSGLEIPENQSMLKIFDKNILENVISQEEINPFLPIVFARAGLKQSTCFVKNSERVAGKSKYSLKKMLKLASNAIFYYSFLRILTFLLLFLVIFNIFVIFLINNYQKIEFIYLFNFINIIFGILILLSTISFLKRANLRYRRRYIYEIKNIK